MHQGSKLYTNYVAAKQAADFQGDDGLRRDCQPGVYQQILQIFGLGTVDVQPSRKRLKNTHPNPEKRHRLELYGSVRWNSARDSATCVMELQSVRTKHAARVAHVFGRLRESCFARWLQPAATFLRDKNKKQKSNKQEQREFPGSFAAVSLCHAFLHHKEFEPTSARLKLCDLKGWCLSQSRQSSGSGSATNVNATEAKHIASRQEKAHLKRTLSTIDTWKERARHKLPKLRSFAIRNGRSGRSRDLESFFFLDLTPMATLFESLAAVDSQRNRANMSKSCSLDNTCSPHAYFAFPRADLPNNESQGRAWLLRIY